MPPIPPPATVTITFPPYEPPKCETCGSEMAMQMIERHGGHICLTCHPPVVRYVPIAEYEALKKERDALKSSLIYALLAPPNVDEAVYTLMEWVDDMCQHGLIQEADQTLLDINLEKLDATLTLGVLTQCYACGLPSFDLLYPEVKARLTTLVPDRVDKILQGLTPDAASRRRKEFGR